VNKTSLLTTIKFTVKNIIERPNIVAKFNYDIYWSDKRKSRPFLSSFQKARAELVSGFLTQGSKVLDIGSGDGSVAKYLSRKSGCELVCSDFSDKALEFLKEQGLNTLKLKAETNYSEVARKNKINTITFLEVLEHLPDPERVLKEASNAVDTVIFSVPNSGYISHRLRLLFGKFPMQWRLHPGEHLRFWTLSDMKWWLIQLEYKNVKVLTYEGFPILNKIAPSIFSRGIIVVLRPPG